MFDEMVQSDYAAPIPPGGGGQLPSRWFFGVHLNEEFVYDFNHGHYRGLRVVFVYYGSPAAARVEFGDIITRVDGVRVETFNDFVQRVTYSPTGVISLRVRDIRTGQFLDISGIQLVPFPANPGGGNQPGGGGP